MYEDEFTPKYPIEYEPINYYNIPFLTKRQRRGRGFNTNISYEKLMLIPIELRRFWHRLDLSYLDIPPVFPPKDAISLMTETPPDLFQMMKDKNKRIKIKAMVLGELDNETLDKMKKNHD